ncbi:dienelactone hydrolase family protein [Nocardia abscessus]|uniref:Dienelactone hydrolase family protein n=1 Tax=Nocardia abscessus TaxID=120957 RepID=A0ABS0C1S3_9NOCA|nr:phosphoribosyltransferase family protein [Nocardia abscessus]MBF6223670.1 dienelactone hydrolase family protein [Nocardia abscessus]
MLFDDRRDAGRRLAERLEYLQDEDVVVVGLPRGGVPVAYEVARALDAPLDVIVVRKLGVPYQPELAFGAIGENDVKVINDIVVAYTQLSSEDMAGVERRERDELARRAERLRRTHPRVPLAGRTVVVVDDGIATGATARAACEVAWAHGAQRVVLAVPVAPRDTLAMLKGQADEVVCLEVPTWFGAVGSWYHRFGQVSDAEVTELLRRAAGEVREPRSDSAVDPPLRDAEVRIQAEAAELAGHLTIPENPVGMVVFAHGSGSSRHSPRNRYVADVLNRAGLGTLLFDLLTPDEEVHRARVFDIELLSRRLVDVTDWLSRQSDVTGLRIGYFGASTGAAAALRAAADPSVGIAAVVSRGGRPDLAGADLAAVRAPTLLIVGGDDHAVLELNRLAAHRMSCETAVAVVPGATHLFAEPGALAKAAELARDWLVDQLAPASAIHDRSGSTTDTRS